MIFSSKKSRSQFYGKFKSFSEFTPVGHLGTEAFERSDTIHCPPLSFDLVTCRQGDAAVDAVKESIEKNRPFSVAFIDLAISAEPERKPEKPEPLLEKSTATCEALRAFPLLIEGRCFFKPKR